MNDVILGLAISVIIIGFFILVGVAIWLAAERRRNLAMLSQPAPQSGSRPAAPPSQTTDQAQQAPEQPPAHSSAATPVSQPAATQGQASDITPVETPPDRQAKLSGAYPAAELYDQTLLPQQPPKRRKRPPAS